MKVTNRTDPIFKSDMEYVTGDGYPLGTEGWFVSFEMHGWVWRAWGSTADEANRRANAVIAKIVETVATTGDVNGEQKKQIDFEIGGHRKWA